MNQQTKKTVSLIAAAAAVILSLFVSPPGIDPILFRGIILTCAYMLLLITNALPTILLCLICVGILPFLGLTESFAASFGGFSNQAVYFVMMSFGLAAVLMQTPLCKRILRWMFRKVGKNIEGLILANMICAAITSAFISDVPTVVIYMTFAELILGIYHDEAERKKTGRCIMIATSLACMIGGIATPVGSTVNIIASSVVESTLGTSVGFIQWVSICLPVVAIMIVVTWKLLVSIYKPAPISDADRVRFINDFADNSKLSGKEIETVIVFLLMLVLWVSSSWIKSISTMQVMFLGVCVLALPKVGVISIEEVVKHIKFDILLLVATMITLCGTLMSHGFGEFIAGLVPAGGAPTILILLGVVLAVYVMILIIPIAPSLTTVAVPTLIVIAQTMGINPLIMIPVCSMAIGCGYLLPTDSVFLITYSKKYYTIKEFMKVSAIVMAISAVLICTVSYGIMCLWGF